VTRLGAPALPAELWPPGAADDPRQSLAAADARLAQWFDEGRGVAELVAARAFVVEQALLALWDSPGGPAPSLALVAVGGFGRGELFPKSDVDLLVLVPEGGDALREPLERYFSRLWDIGIAPGHAVRTPAECLAAAEDLTVATALMEARCIAGDAGLLAEVRTLIERDPPWPPARYRAAKLEEQRARHRRFHGTAHNLEPNLKDGPGGLRDYQLLLWLGLSAYGCGTLDGLVRLGLLTVREADELGRARDVLWRIRYGLHLVAGRAEERLLFEHQRELATRFGFHDEHAQNLAVEQFMQGYYRAAMVVERVGDRFWQRLHERLEPATAMRALDAGFSALGDRLDLEDTAAIARDPLLLLRAFWLLLEHPELSGPSARLMTAIEERLPHAADRLRDDPDALALLLAILRHPGAVDVALRRMARLGLLGTLIPAFAQVSGRMQFDLFHVYTVDQHTLTVVELLAALARPEAEERFALASEVRRRLRKPELLYLAGLFHDIAKGRGGDHAELGEREARAFCAKLGLGAADVDLVAWLVREHLLLSLTAQKQDLTDPAVVQRFASRVADSERLDYLYVLTVADINGTSAKLWNSWKDQLLAELYRATHLALSRGLEHPVHAAEHEAETRARALGELQALGFADADVQGLWRDLPKDTFLRFLPEQVSWISAVMLRGARGGMPLVAVRRRAARGTSAVVVYSPDRDGLFATLTAVLDRCQLDVVEARIMATREGNALDVFQVLEPDGLGIADEERATEIVARLKQALAPGELRVSPARRAATRAERQFAFAPQIEFSALPGQSRTQLALAAADRPGLLAEVAQVLRAHGVRVHGARIATFGARAEDVFELSDEGDRPLEGARQDALASALAEQLARDPTDDRARRHQAA